MKAGSFFFLMYIVFVIIGAITYQDASLLGPIPVLILIINSVSAAILYKEIIKIEKKK